MDITDVPLSNIYSGLVSLIGVRLVILLAEINSLESWATYIGSAYLEAFTKKKVHIASVPEFGSLERHNMMIVKSLCELRTYGLIWHEMLADCLQDMVFEPCKMGPGVWLRPCGEHHCE